MVDERLALWMVFGRVENLEQHFLDEFGMWRGVEALVK